MVSSARAPNASSQRPSSTPGSCCSTAGRSGRMDLKQPRSGTQALRAAVQSALRGEVQLWKKDMWCAYSACWLDIESFSLEQRRAPRSERYSMNYSEPVSRQNRVPVRAATDAVCSDVKE